MKIFILNILLLISSLFYAQEKEDNSDFKQYSSSIFNSKETAFSVVSSMNKKADTFINEPSSGVLIQQIGDFNKVSATFKANDTKLYVEQSGDGNELFLDKTAQTINQNVVQQGDNNQISDFTLRTNYNV